MTNSSRLSAWCDRVIEAGWIAAVVVVPLFFNIYSSRVFEPDKLTLLRSIALVMSAAWIVRTIEEYSAARKAGRERPSLTNGVNRHTPLVLPTLVLIGVYLISTVLSITPYTSLFGSYQRLQGTYTTFSYIVVFFMLLQNMRRRRQLDRLVTAIVMTSMPIAFYGLLQRGNGIETLDPLPWGGDVTSRVAANMGNAIFIAAYMIMAFFLTLGRIVEAFRIILTEQESRWSDILRASAYIFVGAVQLITFSFANSRGPLLGWLPGMFIFGLVGLLLLRVTLSQKKVLEAGDAAPSDTLYLGDTPHDDENRIAATDVLKAIFLSFSSIIAAGLAAGLVYLGFPQTPQPQITLAAVAGLIGGLVPLLVVAGIQRRATRWLWASWIFFSIVGAVGIFLVNFSDQQRMAEARQSGSFGSLGTLFESEGGTGRVRTLIWQGAVELIKAHTPITFPDGTSDGLNTLRPIVGYGPEAMYVAYNRFYPPDLAHYEARNASPDRSHNETLDSFVITGAIGFVAEQFLFISVFFFGLKCIGWVPNRRAAITFAGMMVIGGAAGAIGLGLVKGANFMGTGWPGGVTAGLVIYVVTFALFHFRISTRVYVFVAAVLIAILDFAIFMATFTSANRIVEMSGATAAGIAAFAGLYLLARWAFSETAGQPIAVSGHIFLIVALFGGILSHYLEISLAGIAIAATRTYFWTFAALLVVTGLNWVPADDDETVESEVRSAPAPIARPQPANPPSRKKRKMQARASSRPEPRPSITRPAQSWAGPTIALALIGALILATLGYSFINLAPQRDYTVKVGDTLFSIATTYEVDAGVLQTINRLPSTDIQPGQVIVIPPPHRASPISVIGKSLTRLPYQDDRPSPGTLLMFIVAWVFGAVIALTELRRRNIIKPNTILKASLTYIGVSLGGALLYWLAHSGSLISIAEKLIELSTTPANSLNHLVSRYVDLAEMWAGPLTLFYVVVFLAIVGLGFSLNDGSRSRGQPSAGEWGAISSVPIFGLAVVLLISTNFNIIRADIIFKQGQGFINNNACNGAGSSADNPISQCDIAIAHLKEALQYAPQEDFYMLSLGASYLNKAGAAPTAASGKPSILLPGSTYQSILNLDAERTGFLTREDALIAAQATLDHARQINPLNTDHSANLARMYQRWSDLVDTDAERQAYLNRASDYYRDATQLSPNNAQLWNQWAVVYLRAYELASFLRDQANARAANDQTQAEAARQEAQQQDANANAALQEAQSKLDQSLQVDQQFDETYYWLGELNVRLNKTSEATAAWQEALRLNPDYTEAWGRLTEELLASGNVTDAEKITVDFVNRNPSFLPGWRVLAQRVYLPQGLLTPAIEAARRSVELSAASGDSALWQDEVFLAEALRLSGSYDEALSFAQAALNAAPEDRKADVQGVLNAIVAAQGGIPTP